LLRKITGFHQDTESHWVAELNCGHLQHTRHDPPFFPRPWILTEAGRAERIGTSLDCICCDRQEKAMPSIHQATKSATMQSGQSLAS
jgi:hypothetical protein